MGLLNKNDIDNNAMFSRLQGNIIKGHGRNFTANIFIRFNKNRVNTVKEWIAEFSEQKLTSCKKQLIENENYKTNAIAGDVFYGFLLTSLGYKFLGKDISMFEETFQNGMEKARDKLNDSYVKYWEEGFRKEIHAMILIGDDDQEKLGNAARELIEVVKQFSSITTIEYGNAIRNSRGDGLEHFGYVDGVSQPLFFEDEIQKYIADNGGKNKFDPSAEKELVLVKDPLVDRDDAYGSYFVFRKLEQNVRRFKQDEEKLAIKLEFQDHERLGASLVGRFEDGTPIEVSEDDGITKSALFNNFNYDSNDNSKCPYHAHIRKTNPRTEAHKKHIMARRGIPYGHRNVPTSIEQDFLQMPGDGVGLLFMSFQASIANQFEHIQHLANQVDKENPNDLDPIIGQDGLKNKSTGEFPAVYGDPKSLTVGTFNSAVTLKGGEYFFAPSIPFLKTLKNK
ncbi:MAG: Dyp-type peroxidase [Flavobacteriales bacterium]|nr:Dyp-type peroxidase [Flavobacteriales bacterium]